MVRFKHLRGRPIKEVGDKRDNNEDIFARTFNVHRERKISEILIVRLEEIEHSYDVYVEEKPENDNDYYEKILVEFFDYEWIIHIYVRGIDEFNDEIHNIREYNDFIIRLGFLPWIRTQVGYWDESLPPLHIKKFEEVCDKLETWVFNNFGKGLINKDLSYSILIKLIDGGVITHKNYGQIRPLLKFPTFKFAKRVVSELYGRIEDRTSFLYNRIIIEMNKDENLCLALEDFFLQNKTHDFLKSKIWSNLNSQIFEFLINNPKINFVERVLKAMESEYSRLGDSIYLYEWYTISPPPNFFKKVHKIKPNVLETKIMNLLKSNDYGELSYILCFNLLNFVDPELLIPLLNSQESFFFENLVKGFNYYGKQNSWGVFEFSEDYIYQLGSSMTKTLKNKIFNVLEKCDIKEFKIILRFRWLEYFNPIELKTLVKNSKINFIDKIQKVICTEIFTVEEGFYYDDEIIRYLPRLIGNIIQFIDKEFLEKIFKLDDDYEKNKEDFIWMIENISGEFDKQLKGDFDKILSLVNNGKSI